MDKEKEKWWVCTSKSWGLGLKCLYTCRVKVSFKPRGCVNTATYQNWEEETVEDKEGKTKR